MKPVTREPTADRKPSVTGPNEKSGSQSSSDTTSSPMLDKAQSAIGAHHQSSIDFGTNSNFDSFANSRLAIDTSTLLKVASSSTSTGAANASASNSSARPKMHAYGPASTSNNNSSNTVGQNGSSYISPMHQVRLHTPSNTMSQPSNTTENTVSIPKSPSISSPKTPLGFAGHLLLRKRTSIAFFIDLLSPDSPAQEPLPDTSAPDEVQQIVSSPYLSVQNAKSPRTFKMVSPFSQGSPPHVSPLKEASPTSAIKGVAKKQKRPFIRPIPLSFPRLSPQSVRSDLNQISKHIEEKQRKAEEQRKQFLKERQAQLRLYAETLRQRQVLQKTRQRLSSLKNESHQDYKMTMASLERDLIRQDIRGKRGGATEYTQHIHMMQKLRKYLELRRAFSESFIDYAQMSEDDPSSSMYSTPTEKESQSATNPVPSVSFLTDGLAVTESDEYETHTSPTRLPFEQNESPAGSSTQYAHSPECVSPRPWNTNPDIDTNQEEIENETSPVKGTAPHKGLHEIDVLSNLRDIPRESLERTIRRSRSLPSTLLDDPDDFTFLELLHLLPPVTRFTLRELDLEEILSNVQLRHDLIFDPDLQFRPNTESDREGGSATSATPSSSKSKSPTNAEALKKSDIYWHEVEEEITQGFLYRVPLLLAEIRAILIELLPNGVDIRDEIESNIDIKLISQQIDHGVVNPMGLILYLSQLMKTNCAPVRDELVDQMVAACERGDIAKSLRLCFDILEYMKLDYANHQLSRLRPYVLQHASEFEWKWFQSQLDSQQISTRKTKTWIKAQYETSLKETDGESIAETDFIVDGILSVIQSCNRSNYSSIPETLRLDSSRLSSYSNDWQDITILSSILVLFRQAAGPKCTHVQLQDMKKNLWLLLNDGDTTLTHVALQITKVAGEIRGRPFETKEQEALSNMIDKTLAPESKLYELLLKRVGSHLRTMCFQRPIDKDALAKHGLNHVETEIEELGRKISKLVDLNKSVYGKLYRSILDELKSGSKNTSS